MTCGSQHRYGARVKPGCAAGARFHARSDARLPSNRRYCRVWTSHFLTRSGSRPLRALPTGRCRSTPPCAPSSTSAAAAHINGNAAPAEGDVASPHLTGEAVDIAKKGLTPSEVAWMRAYLLPLQTAGKIDVEEEFQQSCFHISVYRTYTTPRPQARGSPEVFGTGSRRRSLTPRSSPLHFLQPVLPPSVSSCDSIGTRIARRRSMPSKRTIGNVTASLTCSRWRRPSGQAACCPRRHGSALPMRWATRSEVRRRLRRRATRIPHRCTGCCRRWQHSACSTETQPATLPPHRAGPSTSYQRCAGFGMAGCRLLGRPACEFLVAAR